MLLLGEVFAEAGLPDGVLSILPTSNASALSGPLMQDPRLRKVTFTGSTPVGKLLVRNAADQLLRTSMELGGNAPFVVFEDADVDAAVDGAMAAKMRNGGQACTAANRFHVAHAVIEEFTEKLSARISALRTGPGIDPTTDVGPLVNADQRDVVSDLVADAVARGARVRTGGFAPESPGFFYAPTLLDRIPRTRECCAKRSSGPSRPSPDSTPKRRASRPRTTPSTVWPPTSTPATWIGRCGSRPLSTPAWSPSTGHPVGCVRPVRWRQALGFRPRGRHRGHRGVPRDEVRRAVTLAAENSETRTAAARSWLLAAAVGEDALSAAARAGADCLVVDLEDGVPFARKSFARQLVREWLSDNPSWVRIGDVNSGQHALDVEVVRGTPGYSVWCSRRPNPPRTYARRHANCPGSRSCR